MRDSKNETPRYPRIRWDKGDALMVITYVILTTIVAVLPSVFPRHH